MQKCHIESNTHSGKKLSVLYFKHQARRTETVTTIYRDDFQIN